MATCVYVAVAAVRAKCTWLSSIVRASGTQFVQPTAPCIQIYLAHVTKNEGMNDSFVRLRNLAKALRALYSHCHVDAFHTTPRLHHYFERMCLLLKYKDPLLDTVRWSCS
jgi:hypothetical protein